MLNVVPDAAVCDGCGVPVVMSGSSSVIDEIVRAGARRMLAEALQAEVEAYCAQFADVRDENGRRVVVRNGCHDPREVTTCAGAVEVVAPRVNDKRVDPETGERARFSSAILPPWARKTPQIEQVLPLLYLHGLSSKDVGPALGAVPRQRQGPVRLDDPLSTPKRGPGIGHATSRHSMIGSKCAVNWWP
jgi:predicted amidohydrolase